MNKLLKKFKLLSLYCVTLHSSLANAAATLVNFDDLDANIYGSVSVPYNYAGLNWSNFSVIDGVKFRTSTVYYESPSGFTSFSLPKSGYESGVVSSSAVAFNDSGFDAYISSYLNDSFTLNSFYITAAWRNELNIEVTGYLNGFQTNSILLITSREAPTLVTLNWKNVNQIKFHSFGGVSNGPFVANNGLQFALDNLSYRVTAVPESKAVELLLLGVIICCVWNTKISKKISPTK
ncbi:hypothetical protein [Methylophilus sp. 3sh_L]|uniref:hypothetical protein n=1 Tax=Methylophilus sp. 3sh_L TaxID=3377114 RepID=UPI00398EC436